jgi:aryl-alcohol dehydrogenase-like predicted oxidoreductase
MPPFGADVAIGRVAMKGRALGRSGLTVPTVILGAMAPSGGCTRAERARVFHAAFDAGIRAVDTAPLYELGGSEEALGHVLAERSDPITVMTKVGMRWDDDHGDVLFEAVIDGVRRVVRKDARPESIRRDVEESLRRLRLDCVDVVHLHHPDRHVALDESLGALAELVREGKARAIGLSNHEPSAVRRAIRALGEVPLASLQDDYSLLSRWAEAELLPACRSSEIGFLCYSPLARGALSGSGVLAALPGNDPRRGDWLFHRSNVARLRPAVAELGAVARERGESPATTALAWLSAQPGVTGVIVGARTPEQAKANAEALGKTLDAPHERRLRSAFERVRLDLAAGTGPVDRALGLARRAARKIEKIARR